MFRISGRRPPTRLDDVTIERWLDGGSIDDLPDALRPLGEVLAAATNAPSPAELEGSTAAAASFVTARAAAGRSRRRARTVGVSMVAMLVLAASTGTAVAATRGALPDPVQQVAHEALGVVGISVPSIDARSNGHDQPGVATDGPSAPPVSEVSTAPTGADPTSQTGTPGSGTSTSGTGSPGSGSNDEPPDATPGNRGGQSSESAPPATTPAQIDKPVDEGRRSDDTPSPGNSDYGQDQGGDTSQVPPGQAEEG
jgi:hypothetical protein